MEIKIPQALIKDHQEIKKEIDKAIQEGGMVGEAAQKLWEIEQRHIEHEEKFALPPLGLLPKLIAGKLVDEMDVAAEMADELQAEMPKMLNEHQLIEAALDELNKAANQEKKPVYSEFVDWMKLHLSEEEEVYYPSALLVGIFLKTRLSALVQFRYP